MRCAIWYCLYNLKNVKNTHGGVLILVKLQAEAFPVKHPTNIQPIVFQKTLKFSLGTYLDFYGILTLLRLAG